MSYSLEQRGDRIDNKYHLKSHPEMIAHEEQSTTACKPNTAERITEADIEISPELFEED